MPCAKYTKHLSRYMSHTTAVKGRKCFIFTKKKMPISRVILLQVFYSWLQDSVLVPFSLCSVPLGHLVHVHNLNTLRTPNLPLADFPFEH